MDLNEKDIEAVEDPEVLELLEQNRQQRHVLRPQHGGFLSVGCQAIGHTFFLYCVIVALLVGLLRLYTRPCACKDPSQGIYSPAQDVIKYETRVFDENFQAKGPYMGRPDGVPDAGIPTNETDAMWDDLYLIGVSQIPYSSARQLPNATELIPGTEDQYIVELDVFHQLHCLNALRKSFYPERYWDSFIDYWIDDGSPRGRGPRNYTSIDAKHFDHCIDALRQSVMCHGDIATVYWRWMPRRQQPLPHLDVTHTCRLYDPILNWAKEHQVATSPRWKPAPEDTFQQSFMQGGDK